MTSDLTWVNPNAVSFFEDFPRPVIGENLPLVDLTEALLLAADYADDAHITGKEICISFAQNVKKMLCEDVEFDTSTLFEMFAALRTLHVQENKLVAAFEMRNKINNFCYCDYPHTGIFEAEVLHDTRVRVQKYFAALLATM